MGTNVKEAEILVQQSKILKEVTDLKHDFKTKLHELTLCNNVAVLSKRRELFNSKVITISCKVVPSVQDCTSQFFQTLIIIVENVSRSFIFNCAYWQFIIGLNDDRTETTWTLETSLGPGQVHKFCCPFKFCNLNFPLHKVQVRLKFIINFDSKTYTRLFDAQELIVDVLHCVDPARISLASNYEPALKNYTFSDLEDSKQSKLLFPPVTKFLLRLSPGLKERFLKEILLRDSFHRGFSDATSLDSNSGFILFYLGNKIEINFSVISDVIAIKCSNPTVLCAVKASILKRLVLLKDILVEELGDNHKERIYELNLKLHAFNDDGNPAVVSELMEMYLQLRDVSESIRFTTLNAI